MSDTPQVNKSHFTISYFKLHVHSCSFLHSLQKNVLKQKYNSIPNSNYIPKKLIFLKHNKRKASNHTETAHQGLRVPLPQLSSPSSSFISSVVIVILLSEYVLGYMRNVTCCTGIKRQQSKWNIEGFFHELILASITPKENRIMASPILGLVKH